MVLQGNQLARRQCHEALLTDKLWQFAVAWVLVVGDPCPLRCMVDAVSCFIYQEVPQKPPLVLWSVGEERPPEVRITGVLAVPPVLFAFAIKPSHLTRSPAARRSATA